MSSRMIIRIANISVSITIISNYVPIESINFGKTYEKFISKKSKPEIALRIHYGKLPKLSLKGKKPVRGIKKIWELYHINKKQVFIFTPNYQKKYFFSVDYIGFNQRLYSRKPICPAPSLYQIAVLNSDFTKGDIYVKTPDASARLLPNPLGTHLTEIMIMSWLSNRQGLLFHGCGIMDAKRGYLFLGFSGHGKTTMANLWSDESVILHDDRIIVRKIKDKFWMFTAPWGRKEGRKAETGKGVLLNKIFFIRHGSRNRVYPQKQSNSLFMLLHYSYIPVWIKDGGEKNVGFCAQLVQKIPCFLLDFYPDRKTVNYIRNLKRPFKGKF